MTKLQKFKRKINNYLFDHYILKEILENVGLFLASAFSAFVFGFAFCCFLSPAIEDEFIIVTGGVSGLSQNIALIYRLITNHDLPNNTLQSIAYSLLNVPILLFAFFKVGKKFAIYSAVNVVFSSLFISLFSAPGSVGPIVAANELVNGSIITRAIFGSAGVGLSSAIAYRFGLSGGGFDVINFYFAMRKSTGVGKYCMALNGVVITTYALLKSLSDISQWETGFISLFYSIIYLILVVLIIDIINIRNKKVEIQFITSSKLLGETLVANFPHGATTTKGSGVFTGSEREVIYMIVSSQETKKVVALAQRIDPHVFITVTSLVQVYGNFFIKPTE